jgi:hypothetical protein
MPQLCRALRFVPRRQVNVVAEQQQQVGLAAENFAPDRGPDLFSVIAAGSKRDTDAFLLIF